MTRRGRYYGRFSKIERKDFVSTDPTKSLERGVRILKQAGVPFALIGRLAVWYYVPPEAQQLTKGADFAVPHGYLEAVAAVARESHYKVRTLTIGGCGVSAPGIVIDFIDRHPDLDALFTDAVQAAARSRRLRFTVGRVSVPVVPLPYLVVMKLVTHEAKDERDAQELLRLLPARDYDKVRKMVRQYLGYGSVMYLDSLARSIGHPGPGMKRRYLQAPHN